MNPNPDLRIGRIIGVLLLAFLTFNSTVKSQDIKFGILTGFDVAHARMAKKDELIKDDRVFHPMASFNFNGYLGYISSGFWGLSIEPCFIQKGGNQEFTNKKYKTCFNYIYIPILVYVSAKEFGGYHKR